MNIDSAVRQNKLLGASGYFSITLVGLALALGIRVAHADTRHAPANDWPTVGGDLNNSRYSALAKIKTSNVKELGGAWFKEFDAPTRTPPVIEGGMLFSNDAATIYALNPKSGETIWTYKPAGTAPARGGMAVGEGLVFCGLMDGNMIALNAKSGELVWTGYTGNYPSVASPTGRIAGPDPQSLSRSKAEFITAAPTYVDGVVISGLSGGDWGARGKISAQDAKTGAARWSFFVIPAAGERGSESWPAQGDALKLGGGAVWTQGAADRQLGLVYYGTGNAVPQESGETRPGDNLYTSSIVALDIKTGELRWHYQLTHHDIWEMDVSTPVLLYEAVINGKRRPALAAMRTDGYLFVLDRATGAPLFPVEERAVKQDIRQRTAATQPFPVDGDKLGPVCADPAVMAEGFKAGCDFDPIYFDHQDVMSPILIARQAPMSFDPQTGYFYVMGGVTAVWYRRVENPKVLSMTRPPGSKEYGLYAAIDGRTRKIVWQKRSPWALFAGSGALTTAGGLLFYMQGDGTLEASDAKSGETLWAFQTGELGSSPLGNAGGVPISTYEVEGEQYVAVPMGKGLWALKLHGALKPRPALPSPPTDYGFVGLIKQIPADGSGEIAVAGLSSSFVDEQERFVDEFTFEPLRARIKSGASFRWTNYGISPHTIVSSDGAWTTGEIAPGKSVTLSISKPGIYVYYAKEFPWAKGQLKVQ
jgi:PQQ-dependent dehydrogenase (methanol/ethanol family)